jgi:hypothetical protein
VRLIVHIGLHKTGSTYLQHIMNDNHEGLQAAGVYYEQQPGYPAHHFAAWDILRGDASSVGRMIGEARQAGCETVILSSEDLEAAIFDRSAAEAIEAAALDAGVEAIEWHLCVRDAGQYFSSLYAQLQHHVFADPASMLWEVLRDGMIMIIDPLRGGPGTPFWCYCFDHDRYVSAFAEQTAHPVFLHDFRDRQPFPGWSILEAAGALGAVSVLPGDEARNGRMSADAVRLGYSDQILRLLPDEAMRGRLEGLLNDQLRQNGTVIDDYARIVSERFAASTAAALERFGYRAEQPLRAVG